MKSWDLIPVIYDFQYIVPYTLHSKTRAAGLTARTVGIKWIQYFKN